MSDLNKNGTKNKFDNAPTWSLPEISGTVINRGEKKEKKIDLDDVHLFEERIKKQIETIKKQKENPTYLTVSQIEEIQKHAYDEAYQKGYDEAYKKGTEDSETFLKEKLVSEKKDLKQKAQQLQQSLNALSQPLQDIDAEVEQELTNIIFYFCKQLLAQELKVDASHIQHLIQQALTRLPLAHRKVKIKLNPADIVLLEENNVSAGEHDWILESDNNVSIGGCLVEAETASIDLSLESRLKELTAQLFTDLKPPDEIMPDFHDDHPVDDSGSEISDDES